VVGFLISCAIEETPRTLVYFAQKSLHSIRLPSSWMTYFFAAVKPSVSESGRRGGGLPLGLDRSPTHPPVRGQGGATSFRPIHLSLF